MGQGRGGVTASAKALGSHGGGRAEAGRGEGCVEERKRRKKKLPKASSSRSLPALRSVK